MSLESWLKGQGQAKDRSTIQHPEGKGRGQGAVAVEVKK